MNDTVTLIIPIRDRDAWRIEKLVGSLRAQGADPCVVVVDYGSTKAYAGQYGALCRSMGLEYERMETEGLPWNKCHAINRGVRIAQTEYICTVDVDVYFVSDPISVCISDPRGKAAFHVNAFWLDRDGNERKAKPAGLGGPGGFQFVTKRAFEQAGGYDERIVYWGQEDNDWSERLKALGYEMVWLPEPHRVYHQWHESCSSGWYRPVTASYDTLRYCLENMVNPIIKQDWGRAIGASDRPIMDLIEHHQPSVIRFGPNELSKYFHVARLVETKRIGSFIRLDFGNRLIKRPLSAVSDIVKSMLRPVTALVGLDCTKKINDNFDFFYSCLPALKANGLRDFFITADASSVFLFWQDQSRYMGTDPQ